MRFLRPAEAADQLGISYPTIKQWIYSGKLASVKTPGGHHRIPPTEIDRLRANRSDRSGASKPKARSSISGRNRLRGRIREVRIEGLLAQVVIEVGAQVVTAIITRAAAEEMELEPGIEAAALIKATEVMVIRD